VAQGQTQQSPSPVEAGKSVLYVILHTDSDRLCVANDKGTVNNNARDGSVKTFHFHFALTCLGLAYEAELTHYKSTESETSEAPYP
jgi:hypothetical protein